ncbi:MAG: Na+/H+ antiporter NhaC family protein, partial [Pseudomonadota bacterium]
MSESQRRFRSYLLITISFLVTAFFAGPTLQTSWSLVAPALAISVAFLSRSLSLSLGAAVILGAFVVKQDQSIGVASSAVGAIDLSLKYFWQAGSDQTNLQILGFVFFILTTVHIMSASGGLKALVRLMQGFIVGPRSAQLMTAILGCLIFIDDYANTMIVGSTMKRVTDRYKISREKLAFLVDATSAPIAGVALVSTWIGYEVGLFSEVSKQFSWDIDGYGIFLNALPFRFYCFFMLFFVFANILFDVDYGKMREARLSPIQDDDREDESFQGKAICSLLPLGLLLSLVFSLLWIDGGGLDARHSVLSFASWREVLTTSENSILILLQSSVVSFVVASVLGLFFSPMTGREFFKTVISGVRSAGLPITILILAWSLKEVCGDLKTGEFIVTVLGDKISMTWLPIIIFCVSAITAFATGTSWGTMAILIPTVAPLA